MAKKRNKLEVVANLVQFLGSRNDSQGDSSIGQVPVPEDDVPF
jgi:single-stranded DNA-binding protein